MSNYEPEILRDNKLRHSVPRSDLNFDLSIDIDLCGKQLRSRRLSWLVNGDVTNHKQDQYYLCRVFELFQFYYISVTENGIFFVKLQLCCIFIHYQNKYLREGIKSIWRGLYIKKTLNNIFILSIRLGEWLGKVQKTPQAGCVQNLGLGETSLSKKKGGGGVDQLGKF